MMKNTRIRESLVLAAAAIAITAGCGEPTAPASPTWEQDVRPILVARCIRCHYAVPGNVDPKATSPVAKVPTVHSFNFARFQDIGADNLTILKLAAKCARGELPGFMMPPPPAEKLETWQIETLDNWAKNPK